MIAFIWSCMVISFKGLLGSIFWVVGIFAGASIIGGIIGLAVWAVTGNVKIEEIVESENLEE